MKVGTHLARGDTGTGGRWAGLMPRGIGATFRTLPLMPVRDLLNWNGRLEHAVPLRIPLSSWLLYHYLWNQRSRQFGDFQRRLSDGESPARAWRAAFPEYDPARPASLDPLDAELERYRRGGRFTAFEVALPAVDARSRARALAPAEVHLLIASARAGRSQPPVDAEAQALCRADVEEALREDPANPSALVEHARLLGSGSAAPQVAALRAAAAAHPDDWRAWLMLARQLRAPVEAKEREACCRKAAALEPDAASAQNDLAWLLVESGRAREALPFANRAVDLAPWSPIFLDTLAVVAGELGQCPQALQLAQRAVEALPPEGERTSSVRRHLDAFERRCGSPAAPSAAPVPERP